MIDRCCISINAKCNLNCSYCHFGDKKNSYDLKDNEFTKGELKVVINHITDYIIKKDINNFKIGIVGSGEPLLNFDDIVTIVEEIKLSRVSNRVKIYTITNGTMLNKEMLQYFYENRNIIEVNFSLDGDEQIHGLFRKGYNKTMKGINEYEHIFGHKPKINAVVTRHTIENSHKVINFFKENNFKEVNFSIIFGVNDPNLLVTDLMYSHFLTQANDSGLIMRQIGKTKKYDCTKYGQLCGVGRTNIYITKKGIYPCARFQGNLKYKISDFDLNWFSVENVLTQYNRPKDGECYYETREKVLI